ncbi:MAG: cyclic nucleotide-binding domain-containing protein [Betaproteobacteria bacterium]|nr:cyclic nucleotide-binding domain-containing protein [Betaproteobacteria bacterium]
MEDLDFSIPGDKAPAGKPAAPAAPQVPAPKTVYNAGIAMEVFRAAGKAEAVPAGGKFFEEGDKAGFLKRDRMFLLMEGEVAMTVKGRPIGSVKVGEIFGEMAVLAEAPRTATAVAKTNCRVVTLDAKEFQRGLQAKPEFALMLMGMMILRLRAMLARLGASALAGAGSLEEAPVFEKPMLEALAKGLGPQALARHGAGAVLFKEGAAGVLMYVVTEGKVAVSIKGNVVGRVGPGGMFGEMALVDQAARTATATAETDCALLGVNRAVFMNLVKANPEFGAALLGAVAKRVRSIAERLK